MLLRSVSAAMIAAACVVAHASAVTVPFTEGFSASSENWRTLDSSTPLSWIPAGGPDGSAYASASLNFAAQAAGAQPSMIRGHATFNSSGGAPFGDWISSGVTMLTVSVRHNAGVNLPFFVRFAPSMMPGAIAVAFPPVPSGTWTTLTVPINPGYPFIYEGTTFATTFNNIGRVQVGIEVPAALAGQNATYTFDVDRVSLVPAPSALAALAPALLIGSMSRRRRG